MNSVFFKIVVCTFNTNQNKKYPNFERNEIPATVFLKWTYFNKLKKIFPIKNSANFERTEILALGHEFSVQYRPRGLPWGTMILGL